MTLDLQINDNYGGFHCVSCTLHSLYPGDNFVYFIHCFIHVSDVTSADQTRYKVHLTPCTLGQHKLFSGTCALFSQTSPHPFRKLTCFSPNKASFD